jgi:cobaltochelatase CobT
MASNSKTKPSPKESPAEPFKRAVTGCMRAIAKKPDLEVSFAAERPGVAGGKARLPEPPRKLTRTEAAIVRGHSDALAPQGDGLRIANFISVILRCEHSEPRRMKAPV